MKSLCARALAVALLLASTAPTRAGVIEEFNVEGWIVGAYSDNRTGLFSHCATSVPYRSGLSLLFHLNRNYLWTMGFSNPRWQLNVGSEYSVSYNIDRGPRFYARGRVINNNFVQADLADSRALFENFRRGSRLHVQAGGDAFVFNLTNSSRALAATLECTQRHIARSSSSGSPSAELSPTPQGGGPQSGDFRSEAASIAANVVANANIAGFRILSRDQITTELQRFDAVWTADNGLVGTVTILTQQAGSGAEQVAASLMSADAQSCRGAFASGRYPTQTETGVARLTTACRGSANPSEVSYTIAPRPSGGFYVIGVTGNGNRPETVHDAGARVHEAALRSLGRR